MKKTLFIIAFVFSISNYAQEINFENGKFYQNGTQISSRDTKILLESNVEALKLFRTSKDKESIGGFLIGFGGTLIIADLVKGLVSDSEYPTAATYIGIGSLAISIPILSGKKKKMQKAIDLYNSGLSQTGFNNDFQLNFVSNNNGFGFKLNF